MISERCALEDSLGGEDLLHVKRYKWRLIVASLAQHRTLEGYRGDRRWRHLATAAFKEAGTWRLMNFKFTLERMLADGLSREQALEEVSRREALQERLLLGSNILLYPEHFMGVIVNKYFKEYGEAVESSLSDAQRYVENLYVERCMLPANYYIGLRCLAETSLFLETAAEDADAAFQQVVRLKDEADEEWRGLRDDCSNFDQWLEALHLLFGRYRVAKELLLFAAQVFEERGDEELSLACKEEEYSAEEFAADCYAGIQGLGINHTGVLDIFSALAESDLAAARRAVLFQYSGTPRWPRFVFDAATEWLERNGGKEGVSTLLMQSVDEVLAAKLDEPSRILFEEARRLSEEFSGPPEPTKLTEVAEKKCLDMVVCPSCRSKLDLIDFEQEEFEQTGFEGELECTNPECAKHFPIEVGVVKWGHDTGWPAASVY